AQRIPRFHRLNPRPAAVPGGTKHALPKIVPLIGREAGGTVERLIGQRHPRPDVERVLRNLSEQVVKIAGCPTVAAQALSEVEAGLHGIRPRWREWIGPAQEPALAGCVANAAHAAPPYRAIRRSASSSSSGVANGMRSATESGSAWSSRS